MPVAPELAGQKVIGQVELVEASVPEKCCQLSFVWTCCAPSSVLFSNPDLNRSVCADMHCTLATTTIASPCRCFLLIVAAPNWGSPRSLDRKGRTRHQHLQRK